MEKYDTNGTYASDTDDILQSDTFMGPDNIRYTSYTVDGGQRVKLNETSLSPRELEFRFGIGQMENNQTKIELGLNSNNRPQLSMRSDGWDEATLRPGFFEVVNGNTGAFTVNGGSVDCKTLTASSRVYASAFYETSDARQKNVGESITNVLDKLEEIPTVYYKWKDRRDDDRHVGTLAQDVLRVFPETVGGDEDNGYTVDYAKLSIIALAAIKELKGEVDMLKDEIRRLKDKSDAR